MLPLRNYPMEGQKRRGGKRVRNGLTGPCGVVSEALGLRAAFRCSMEGCSVAPSGIIRQGGERDALDWRVGRKFAGLATSNRARWEIWAAFCHLRRNAPSPLWNVPSGGQKRRGERETRRWRLAMFDRDLRKSEEFRPRSYFKEGAPSPLPE